MNLNATDFVINEPTYEWDNSVLNVTCSYACGEHSFSETYVFSFPSVVHKANEEALQALLRLVAIAAAPSYYKALLSQKVMIDYPSTPSIQSWAEQLFDHGLREFRFTNEIPYAQIPECEATAIEADKRAAPSVSLIERCLVPIGGGKDSATSLEIIQSSGVEVVGFSVGDFEAINATAKVADIDLVRVERTIDPALFALNEEGAPNGHVPVTAITSTLACVGALCINADAVVMSNESSADEPTRVVDGVEVNHQWSKSTVAENLLRDALSASGITINYFSLLRALSEYEIFSLFSTFTRFHYVFTSCNRVFTIDKDKRASTWCGNCDKCRFVFLGLSAFMGDEEAAFIIGVNMFEDESQVQGFLDLLGKNNAKPFECVGTTRESQLFARNALLWESAAESVLGQAFKEVFADIGEIGMSDVKKSIANIPPTFVTALRTLQTTNYSVHMREHCEEESFALVGVGRDTSGIATLIANNSDITAMEVYLPEQETISDEEFSDILSRHELNDLSISFTHVATVQDLTAETVFVSPGISKYSDDVVALGERATTPLAWWLEYNKFHLPDTTFIGVTGTKGKSTTASMLNHVLDHSLVAGNLGHAVGYIDVGQLVAADVIILEVSSFQASYVTQSPDVVAITSLFDCHIDWHGTRNHYFADKLNLAAHGARHVVLNKEIEPIFNDISVGYSDRTYATHLVDIDTTSLRARNEAMTKVITMIVAPEMSQDEVDGRLEKFEDLKYRHEKVGEVNGVTYIADVLSTAPEAVTATLDDTLGEYHGTVFLLFGGADRDVDHSLFIKEINERSDRVVVVALPETGHAIESELSNVEHGEELVDGVALAVAQAKKGDVVLLAPGAPSFHRYENYEKLAAHFEELVTSLSS